MERKEMERKIFHQENKPVSEASQDFCGCHEVNAHATSRSEAVQQHLQNSTSKQVLIPEMNCRLLYVLPAQRQTMEVQQPWSAVAQSFMCGTLL